MNDPFPDPHRVPDAAALAQARAILEAARDAVLSVLDPQGWPMVSRIALQADAEGRPLAMLSDLALHTAALRADRRAALLLDAPAEEPGRGMPLTRARLSLQVEACPVSTAEDEALRRAWVAHDPKAVVYARLGDFRLWRMLPRGGLLNAGFGRAYRLTAADLSFGGHDERPGD